MPKTLTPEILDATRKALQSSGSFTEAANQLGIARSTLRNRIDRSPDLDSSLLGKDLPGAGAKSKTEMSTDESGKVKLTSAQHTDGSLEDKDLHSPESLMAEHGIDSEEFIIGKLDLSKRDAGTASAPRVNHTLSLSLYPKQEPTRYILTPAEAPPARRPRRRRPLSPEVKDRILILSDPHCPFHDKRLHALIVEGVIPEIEPTRTICAGDGPDWGELSRYGRARDSRFNTRWDEDAQAYWEWRKAIVDASPKDAKHYDLDGNHDRARFLDRLNQQAPELVDRKCAGSREPVISFERVMGYESMSVELIAEKYPNSFIELSPGGGGLSRLILEHGSRVAQGAGNSARAEVLGGGHGTGVIMGHVHRLAAAWRRQGATGIQIPMIENGWLGDMEAPIVMDYAKKRHLDWQNGFHVITTYEDGSYSIEQAIYADRTLRLGDRAWRA